MAGVVDEIKSRLDILEVIGEYLRLVKAGRNYKARCPFHSEKSPSFMVSPERQIWHCFGCNQGGDVFKFVMLLEGIEFGDALRILARKAGVVLQRQDPQIQSQKTRLYEICELAAKFFEAQLEKGAAGNKVKKYLLERGLIPETIKAWRLGFAPDDWRALHPFLKSRGYKDEEILQAGLIAEKQNSNNSPGAPLLNLRGGEGALSSYYDRFRSRIIFPIFDIQGQVIAFGGRIFGEKTKDDVAKYVNSPQTPLYDKSRVLYGLNKSKTDIRTGDLCVIVEGYMDLIMSWQAGLTNVVASSGTALTEIQLNIIGRYSKNLTLSFDADIAGDTATHRSIDLAMRQDFNLKVISIEDKDPADVIKKNPADWLRAIEEAQSVMQFYFASAFGKYDSQTSEGKREIKKSLLPIIKAIPGHTEQSEWLRELARRLRADEKDLRFDLEKSRLVSEDLPAGGSVLPAAPESKSRLEWLEERILGLCLNDAQPWQNAPVIEELDLQNENLAQILLQLKILIRVEKKDEMISRLKKSLSPELSIQLDYLSLKIQRQPFDELVALEEMQICLRELKIIKIRQELVNLSFDIKEAQAQADKSKLMMLLEKFSQLSKELIKFSCEVNIK
jgi:DNA primase